MALTERTITKAVNQKRGLSINQAKGSRIRGGNAKGAGMNPTESMAGKTTPFKICGVCNTEWQSRDNFLSDPDIELVGYQVHFETLTAGLLYFNHSCKGSLAFYADDFMDLYDGPVFTQRATNGEDCPGHCLHKENLGPCPAKCECASVREVLRIVRGWQKIPTV